MTSDDWKRHLLEQDDDIRAALAAARTVAVLGFKSDPAAAAYRIPAYLHEHGYRVLPVSPKLVGQSFWDQPACATLAELVTGADIIDVFRAAQAIPGHVEEILRLRPRPALVWLQLGIRHDDAAETLARAGIAVVQDRCLMVEHHRLLGHSVRGDS